MSELVSERHGHCPFCAQPITVVVDLSAGSQTYFEDCQVCCQPMQISLDVDDHELLELRIERGG